LVKTLPEHAADSGAGTRPALRRSVFQEIALQQFASAQRIAARQRKLYPKVSDAHLLNPMSINSDHFGAASIPISLTRLI
jgi:hypothetical protein